MSKFRARQLDATKPIPIYLQEDISDYTDLNNASNRTVPQMPTGMEKEEETEHHLQQAIFHHRVIPVPEVYPVDYSENGKIYDSSYKQPRQLIHINPFSAEQDIPDYDMDSEDEVWLSQEAAKGELLPLHPAQFEEMMDRLEKSSGLKAVTLQEAKVLLKEDDDLITAVYDYWLNKRLRLQHALIPQVKTEKGVGSAPSDPYVAFRKRTEKMQTRKNRKNDESSYEKMLKLKRDLSKSITMLQMVCRREKTKRELLHLNIEIFEKRYELQDWSGQILQEVMSSRAQMRSAFAPLVSNHLNSTLGAGGEGWLKVPAGHHSSPHHHNNLQHPNTSTSSRRGDKEKVKRERKYRKVKHSSLSASQQPSPLQQQPLGYSHPPDPFLLANAYPQPCDDESSGVFGTSFVGGGHSTASPSDDDSHPDGAFAFVRKHQCQYYAPLEDGRWAASQEGGEGADTPAHYSLVSLPHHYQTHRDTPTPPPPLSERHHTCTATSQSRPSLSVIPQPSQQQVPLVSPLLEPWPCLVPAASSSSSAVSCSPPRRHITLARRRLGRGGRMWVDRMRLSPPSSPDIISGPLLREHYNGASLTGHTADLLARLCDAAVAKSNASSSNSLLSSLPKFMAPPNATVLGGSDDEDTDTEVDIDSVATASRMRVTTPRSGQSCLVGGVTSRAGSQSTAASPVSWLLTAEVLDGIYEGAAVDLQLSLPPADDNTLESGKVGSSDIFMDNSPILRTDEVSRGDVSVSSSVTCRSLANSFNSLPVIDSAHVGVAESDICESIFKSSSCSSGDPHLKTSPSRPPHKRPRHFHQKTASSPQHSSQFSIRPSSKFNTLDSYSSQLKDFQLIAINNVNALPFSTSSTNCDSDSVSHSALLISSSMPQLPSTTSLSSSNLNSINRQITLSNQFSSNFVVTNASLLTSPSLSNTITHSTSDNSSNNQGRMLAGGGSCGSTATVSSASSGSIGTTIIVSDGASQAGGAGALLFANSNNNSSALSRSGAPWTVSTPTVAVTVSNSNIKSFTHNFSDGTYTAPITTTTTSAAAAAAGATGNLITSGNACGAFLSTTGSNSSNNSSSGAVLCGGTPLTGSDSLLLTATTTTSDNISSSDSGTCVVNSVDSSNKLTSISFSSVSTSIHQSQSSYVVTNSQQQRQTNNSNFPLNNNANPHEVVYFNTRSTNNGNSVLSNSSSSLRSNHKILAARTPGNVTGSSLILSNSLKAGEKNSDMEGSSANVSITNGPSRNNVLVASKTATQPIVKCAKLDQYLFRDS